MSSVARTKLAIPNVLPSLRTFMVALFLALQSFLIIHQFEHGLETDLAGSQHDCALCQASANLLPAPEPVAVTVPVAFVEITVLPATEQDAIARVTVAGFRSRAPPLSASA